MEKRFSYTAKNTLGETVTGNFPAKTFREAAQALHEKNLIALEITEEKKGYELLNREFRFRFMPVAANEFGRFCRQFHIVLSAGIPILKCLELIKNETKNKMFAKDISGVCCRIQSGEHLSDAIRAYPKSFPSLFVFMVEAGEMSGNLPEILFGMAEHYEIEEKNRRQIQQILFYPIILVFVVIAVVIFLLTCVLPTFVGMFEAMDVVLPKPTQLLLVMSQVLTIHWPAIVLSMFGCAVFMGMVSELPLIRMISDYLKIKLPLIGSLNQKRCLAIMAKTLAMLLSSGVDLISALNRLAGITENQFIKKEVENLREKVANGTRLGQGMAESEFFPSLFCQLVSIGESSGSLAEVLETINLIYKDEINARIQLMGISLEPLILILLGGVVLFILAAIMLPVFDIYAAYSNM